MDGKFTLVQAERRGVLGRVTRGEVPGPIRIVAIGPGSGFVRDDESQRVQGSTVRGRHLLEAPAAGYERELVLTPREVMVKHPVYFYVKLGDRYGRGYIERVDWDFDLQQLTAMFRLQIGPDDSRNLETGEPF